MKIAIASGKGGTGKTLLSTNLADFLGTFYKVVLIDLDVEEPNDSLFISGSIVQNIEQFKMIPVWQEFNCKLCGFCAANCKFHAVVRLGDFITVFNQLCHSCFLCSDLCPNKALPMNNHKIGTITEYSTNSFFFVESRLDVGEEQAVPLIHKTHNWIDKYFNDYDIQLFDCPPGTSCPVVAATENSDFVILVTEPTPFGLNDLVLAVETMKKMNNKFAVIINRDGLGNNDVECYCNKNQIPIITKIPYSRDIAESYSKGELSHNFSNDLQQSLQIVLEFIQKVII